MLLKVALISGAFALAAVGMSMTPIVGPLGPCANTPQTINLLVFVGSFLISALCFSAYGLRWLARRFPRQQ